MARYEQQLLRRFRAVVAVAERDRAYFQENYGATNVSVIPTGVELDYFNWVETPPLDSSDAGTLVFTGSMDWMANIDAIEFFMDQVWPRVARARPNARFVVVGRAPPAALVARASARGLNWTFTGFVDDVRRYVHEAHLYVIPLRVGGGTRIKVYEAMAMGCPVVSTRIGVEGLHRYGEDALAKDIATNFLGEVQRVFDDQHKLAEKYDATGEEHGGGGEYPLQDGFGWTNGVVRALLMRYPVPDAVRKPPGE